MTQTNIQISQDYPLEIVEWIDTMIVPAEAGVKQDRKQKRFLAIIQTHEIAAGFARAFEGIPGDDAEARKDCIERFMRFVEAMSELPDQSPLNVVLLATYDQEEDLDDTSDTRKALRTVAEQMERSVDLKHAYEELRAAHENTAEGAQDALSPAIDAIHQRWMLEKIETLATTNLHDWDRDSAISAVLRAIFPYGGGVRS